MDDVDDDEAARIADRVLGVGHIELELKCDLVVVVACAVGRDGIAGRADRQTGEDGCCGRAWVEVALVDF